MSPAPQQAEVRKAHAILQYANDTATALLDAFHLVRKSRGVGQGAPMDEEQDLLRAMLVFAAAGLDSMLKQLIRDSLTTVATTDAKARAELAKFAQRELRREGREEFLATLLTTGSPMLQLIDEFADDLVGGSLQSPDELCKAVRAFGLEPSVVGIDPKTLKPIFDARNQIVHEMDIDFAHSTRNRRARTKPTMIQYTNQLLEVAEAILQAVDGKLPGNGAADGV